MAKLSDAAQLDIANKLSLGITSTNTDKNYFEEGLAWEPTVLASAIWSEDVPFAASSGEADAIADGSATDSPTVPVVEKLTLALMDEIPLSNEQGWSLYETPGIADPDTQLADWLNPQLFGSGYFFELFENDNTPIALTDGRYQVDSKNGIVRFDEGFTPADLGLSTPLKITVYRYVGDKGVIATQAIGPTGATGPDGIVGPTGPDGIVGPTGDAELYLEVADFSLISGAADAAQDSPDLGVEFETWGKVVATSAGTQVDVSYQGRLATGQLVIDSIKIPIKGSAGAEYRLKVYVESATGPLQVYSASTLISAPLTRTLLELTDSDLDSQPDIDITGGLEGRYFIVIEAILDDTEELYVGRPFVRQV